MKVEDETDDEPDAVSNSEAAGDSEVVDEASPVVSMVAGLHGISSYQTPTPSRSIYQFNRSLSSSNNGMTSRAMAATWMTGRGGQFQVVGMVGEFRDGCNIP